MRGLCYPLCPPTSPITTNCSLYSPHCFMPCASSMLLLLPGSASALLEECLSASASIFYIHTFQMKGSNWVATQYPEGTPFEHRGLMPNKLKAGSDSCHFLAQSSEVRGHMRQGTRMAMPV